MSTRDPGRIERERGSAGLPRLIFAAVALALVAVCLYPVAHRELARREAVAAIEHLVAAPASSAALERVPSDADLLELRSGSSPLASWGNIGGCGAGGGGSGAATGGVKWVGRGVTGGAVDLQLTGGETFLEGGYYSSMTLRLGTALDHKWLMGVNLPFLVNVQQVEIAELGRERTAVLPAFGDVSVELTRKLGMDNASSLTFSLAIPTGDHDVVREGVVLPQQMQPGAGVFSGGMTLEHTFDQEWGLIVLGGSVNYGGRENQIVDSRCPGGTRGDRRGSGAAAWVHAGYIAGPFLPSAGLTLSGKFAHNQETRCDPAQSRAEVLELDDSLYLASLQLATEWSSDYLALLLAVSAPFSLTSGKPESVNVTLGLQTSLF